MKNLITLFSFVFILGIFTANAQCCDKSAQAGTTAETLALAEKTSESPIEAYYFHTSRRCVTCRNVERISSEILEELYGDKIVLRPVNLENKENEELVKKLEVAGQALLIVNGTKKVDITTDGFMLAMRDREKFKEKIKATVESLK
ncbi:MAG: hypothetical protein K0B11_14265 [Mariniphaga sp.]|nr:hypothetical protein [Mariniphaga sp.]